MKIIQLYIIAFLTVFFVQSTAQDVQYSQYYASSVLMNPAFTGATRFARVSMCQRLQWMASAGKLTSSAVTYDRFFYYHKIGLGGNLQYDRLASGVINNLQIGPSASYLIMSKNNRYLRLGLGCNFVNKKYQTASLVFGDQLDPDFGQFTAVSVDKYGNLSSSKSYLDINSGLLYNTKSFWFGFAMHHINTPKENNIIHTVKTPPKIGLHTGYKIDFKDNKGLALQTDKSLTLTANLKNQGKATQLDLGAYFLIDKITFGTWYRGLPIIHSKNGFINQDAWVTMIGFENRGFRLAYSYDLTLSALSYQTGGSHELSMVWEFGDVSDKKKSKPGKMKTMYMPFPKL